jgi:hypothetical protein
MEATIRTEQRFLEAVGELRDRTTKDKFAEELYRAMASRRWAHEGGGEPISFSWGRSEEIVNSLREQVGEEPLELAQSGDEGELSDDVREELERRGWYAKPFNPNEHQQRHVTEPHGPPPRKEGEEQAPVEPPAQWREAMEQAEQSPRGGRG